MVYLFVAPDRNPQNGQPINYPPGIVERFVLNFPGARDEAIQAAKAQKLGTQGVRYLVLEVPPNAEEVMVLAFQIRGASGPAQPVFSSQHIQGGQPVGMPHGQPNQVQPEGPRDQSGFQSLGGDALDASNENMYGTAEDGTWSDLVSHGGGFREQPRQG